MSFRQPTQSDPRPQPKSGLTKALENLGRTRGSSATPVPAVLSPTPNRDFQSKLEKISGNSNQGNSNNNRNMSPSTIRSSSSSTQGAPVHNRNLSASTAQSNQGQGSGFTMGSSMSPASVLHFPSTSQGSAQAIVPSQMSVSQLSAYFQKRLIDMQQIIKGTPGIPGHVQDALINEVRKISQEFNEQQRRLQQDFDRTRNERVQLQAQLDEAHCQLHLAIQDRDRYCTERDCLQEEVDKLRMKHHNSSERLDQIDEKWKRINEGLVKQIAAQEEQLKGKRALWLDSNPASSARRDAMAAISDPFNSPSASHSSGMGGGKSGTVSKLEKMSSNLSSKSGNMGNVASPPTRLPSHGSHSQSPPIQPPTGPSQKFVRRRGNLPVGKAQPHNDVSTQGPWGSDASRIYDTEPGDTPLASFAAPPSMALVLHAADGNPAPQYRDKISTIYALIEGWAKTYACVPNLENDQAVARSNDILWAYMMNCTYPGHRQDSHTHVMTLLQNVKTRYWFVMRMAVTYCVKDIMSIEVFYKFSPAVESILVDCKKKLMERGLANEVRQEIIDKQARAVQAVVEAPSYATFRNNQLSYHTKRLRDMLGPLLNNNASRSEAGKDLGAIAVNAWDTCAKMHTSFLTFQVYFPETSTKFTASTMEARDQPKLDGMQLQIQQARLKLVITPVVTMRDDRGTTIKAKNLHKSLVLTMS